MCKGETMCALYVYKYNIMNMSSMYCIVYCMYCVYCMCCMHVFYCCKPAFSCRVRNVVRGYVWGRDGGASWGVQGLSNADEHQWHTGICDNNTNIIIFIKISYNIVIIGIRRELELITNIVLFIIMAWHLLYSYYNS